MYCTTYSLYIPNTPDISTVWNLKYVFFGCMFKWKLLFLLFLFKFGEERQREERRIGGRSRRMAKRKAKRRPNRMVKRRTWKKEENTEKKENGESQEDK